MSSEDILREIERVRREVGVLAERVGDLENEREAIKRLPQAVAEIYGALTVLQEIVLKRFDKVDVGVKKASSWDTFLKLTVSIVVPIIIACVAGYFALKAASIGASK